MTESRLDVRLICAAVMMYTANVQGQATLDALLSEETAATTTSQPSAAAGADAARVPIPAPQVARISLDRVKDIFASEYALATTAPKQADLAKRLVTQVSATTDPADRWTLLSEALRLAIEGGDATTALPLIERIPSEFAVERNASRLEALTRLAQKTTGPEVSTVAKAVIQLANELLGPNDENELSKATALASSLARKSRNQALINETSRLQQNTREQLKLAKEMSQLLDKVRENPADSESHAAAGSALCLKAGRWAEGLPLLAKGSDSTLAKLAKAELAKPQTPSEVIRLADGWWDWGSSQKAAMKEGAIRHAADLYQTALPSLSGLDKVKVEKRVHEATLGSEGSEQAVYLADIKESRVTGAKYGFSKDGTYMGKPFMCLNEKWPKAIAAIADDNSMAAVEYQLPASVSRIQGRVGVFSPSDAKPDQQPGGPLVFEVVADGRVAWRSPPMTKRDAVQAFRADIRGATTIELRTQTTSGYCAWGAWLDPQVVR